MAKEVQLFTQRDKEIVEWVSRLGAAGAEHVMTRFSMGRSSAYARLNRLVDGGLLESQTLLHLRPGLYMATQQGLRWVGMERLGSYRLSVAGFTHAWQVAESAVQLQGGLPGWSVVSERELRMLETDHGKRIGSVQVGELPSGVPALHRPDLVLLGPPGRAVAVEVELSVKSARRLSTICRAYARARHLQLVYYLAAPGPAGAVQRAVRRERAEDRITVLDLGGTDGLASGLVGEVDRARV